LGTVTSKTWDILRLIRHGGPALCNVAVTNACNAACDFCNFARGKIGARHFRWIDADLFERALDILRERGIRYVSFFGGEPLLHKHLAEMISQVVKKGMGPALITNGWSLASKIDRLAEAGLRTIYISIDAPTISAHEKNRGLNGLGKRIVSATSRMKVLGMKPLAQVTMSKLISDYSELIPMLQELGFAAVAFSYPQGRRLGSTSMAWSDDSRLVKFTPIELAAAFDSVNAMRSKFPVNNPSASIADMKRHLARTPERFVCYGGYKSFYMDWNYDMWRCDAWDTKLCSVWNFATTPLVRDGCTACIADCYRDSSVMLHFAVSIGDSIDSLRDGHVLDAFKMLADPRNLSSIGAIVENAHVLSRLARLG
jgi:MoaA/NifB/PqqE/SkfB family radical SAM enzyme